MNMLHMLVSASLLAVCALPAQALEQVQTTATQAQAQDKPMPVDAALAG